MVPEIYIENPAVGIIMIFWLIQSLLCKWSILGNFTIVFFTIRQDTQVSFRSFHLFRWAPILSWTFVWNDVFFFLNPTKISASWFNSWPFYLRIGGHLTPSKALKGHIKTPRKKGRRIESPKGAPSVCPKFCSENRGCWKWVAFSSAPFRFSELDGFKILGEKDHSLGGCFPKIVGLSPPNHPFQ